MLIEQGAWSQYLEVGIGPDAEIFTKCQPMASVGTGMDAASTPIPPGTTQVRGRARRLLRRPHLAATLGNDVNLRDVEGRAALLLRKAKDNNASCAVGPFLRFFDAAFHPWTTYAARPCLLTVEGEDGFRMNGASSIA